MTKSKIEPTGREAPYGLEEIIVSKTDLKGRITYANDIFLRVSGYSEGEIIGQPHSCIRHPDMPRSVFKLLWDTIMAKKEIFAYVVNLAKNGDHYWVFAHVTPSLDASGNVIGFHSNRRKPDEHQVKTISGLYKELTAIENKPASRKDGMLEAFDHLTGLLEKKGVSYDEFIFSV